MNEWREKGSGLQPITVIPIEEDVIRDYCYWRYLASRYESILTQMKKYGADEKVKEEFGKKYIEASIMVETLIRYIREEVLPPCHQNKTFIPSLANNVLFIYDKGGVQC